MSSADEHLTPGPPVPPSAIPGPIERSPGFWRQAWQQYRRKKLAMAALLLVTWLGLIAILAPAIVGTRPVVCKYKGEIYFPALYYFNPDWEPVIFSKDKFRQLYQKNLKEKDPESWAIWPLVFQDPYHRNQDNEWEGLKGNPTGASGVPSLRNLMGTSQDGIDVFAQMVHGTTISLLVGFVSMGIASLIGITLGAIAGYVGGWADMLLSRVLEVVLCIPPLALILAVQSILDKPTIWHMMMMIGCTGWTTIARLTRAEFLKLRDADFVLAARAMGLGWPRIVFRHILPNALTPVLVPITFGIASAILTESSLSYLG
ncbi:MAG: ABC transporter permease, partial [Planctomycetota bacterium]|nr:ABC transporter permease [Planctomycetota bacterium]